MKNINAVFRKHLSSMIRMPLIWGQAGLFFVIMLVFGFFDTDCEDCIRPEPEMCDACIAALGEGTPSMAGTFTFMFVGMVLMSTTSGLVQEDKTTKNLKFMNMANVKAWQYIMATFPAVFLIALPVAFLFPLGGRYFGIMELLVFVSITLAGMCASIMLGMVMGLSPYPGFSFPLGMIIGFGPMIANTNAAAAQVLRFTFNQQVNLALRDLEANLTQNFMIIGINFAVFLIILIFMHRKGRLLA